eukprot:6178206-Pleurochrysis_carterae.AAC.1
MKKENSTHISKTNLIDKQHNQPGREIAVGFCTRLASHASGAIEFNALCWSSRTSIDPLIPMLSMSLQLVKTAGVIGQEQQPPLPPFAQVSRLLESPSLADDLHVGVCGAVRVRTGREVRQVVPRYSI